MDLTVRLNKRETVWGFRYLLFQLVFLPSLLSLAVQWLLPRLTGAEFNLLYYFINLSCIVWIFRSFLWDNLKLLRKNAGRILLTALAGFFLYLVLSRLMAVLTVLIMPDFSNVNDSSIMAMVEQAPLLMTLITVVLVPPVEECLYRGLLFGTLLRKKRCLAYLISALVFCAIHVAGYVGQYEPLLLLVCFVQYLPAGLVLAWVYRRADSIFAPILIHMAVNAMGILISR